MTLKSMAPILKDVSDRRTIKNIAIFHLGLQNLERRIKNYKEAISEVSLEEIVEYQEEIKQLTINN